MHENPESYTLNNILLALKPETFDSLRPRLERVELPLGQVLYRADEPISHVYFPERSIVSVVAYTGSGQGAEVAVIGSEGAAGLDVILGSDNASNEHVTQLADGALRMKTADVREQFALGGEFQELLLGFTQKFIAQISQTALCNRVHTTEKRLARWLLMFHDRSHNDVLKTTQEFIAVLLGSNRSTVTMTAIELQNKGFISYSRGKLTIVDRPGLEGFACSCYETIRKAYGPIN
ncbi:MAG: Crp/Fnr family transcriptional regulator [Pyrinomonadaceae bacterium]